MSSIQQEQYVLTGSKGNEAFFGENAGKQFVAMSLTAIIYHHIEDINLWTSSILNNILTIEIICILILDVLSRQMIICF